MRWILLILAAVLLIVGIANWWMAVRDFALLEKHGLLNFRESEVVPGLKSSKWLPLSGVESYALQEPPERPAAFARALGRIDSVDDIMVFSFGPVDPIVWDALGKIEITEWLDLNYDSVDDYAFLSFQNVEKVKGLRIDDTKVTDAGLEGIERFKSVEEIEFDSDKMTVEAIRLTGALPALKHFYFNELTNPHLDRAAP